MADPRQPHRMRAGLGDARRGNRDDPDIRGHAERRGQQSRPRRASHQHGAPCSHSRPHCMSIGNRDHSHCCNPSGAVAGGSANITGNAQPHIGRYSSTRGRVADMSFYVQLKASSVQKIVFSESELEWLRELRLPYFVGIVDADKSELRLFTTHRLELSLRMYPYESICLKFGEPPEEEPQALDHRIWRKEESTTDSGIAKKAEVWLGDPVYVLRSPELSQVSVLEDFWSVLGPLLRVLDRNIRWRQIFYNEDFTWETGKPLSPRGFGLSTQVTKLIGELPPIFSEAQFHQEVYNRGLSTILDDITPGIRAWIMHAITNQKVEAWELLEPIAEALVKHGSIGEREFAGLKAMAAQHLANQSLDPNTSSRCAACGVAQP